MNAEVRTMKTAAEQALAQTFASARDRLPGKGAVAALREDAFQRFDKQGLPHRRVEEWKYTDLRALMRDAYPLAAPPDAAAKLRVKDAGKLLTGVDSRRSGLYRRRVRARPVGPRTGRWPDHRLDGRSARQRRPAGGRPCRQDG